MHDAAHGAAVPASGNWNNMSKDTLYGLGPHKFGVAGIAKDRFRTKSGTTMTSPAEVCRQNAATCEQQAEGATDALAKQTFRNAAEQWLNLAALVEGQEKSEWHKADIVSGRRNVR